MELIVIPILLFMFVQYGIILILLSVGSIRTIEKLTFYCIPIYWLYVFFRNIIRNIKLMVK